MEKVAAQPSDINSIPWKSDCSGCTGLKSNYNPGLFTYVSLVASHFEVFHKIELVGK